MAMIRLKILRLLVRIFLLFTPARMVMSAFRASKFLMTSSLEYNTAKWNVL